MYHEKQIPFFHPHYRSGCQPLFQNQPFCFHTHTAGPAMIWLFFGWDWWFLTYFGWFSFNNVENLQVTTYPSHCFGNLFLVWPYECSRPLLLYFIIWSRAGIIKACFQCLAWRWIRQYPHIPSMNRPPIDFGPTVFQNGHGKVQCQLACPWGLLCEPVCSQDQSRSHPRRPGFDERAWMQWLLPNLLPETPPKSTQGFRKVVVILVIGSYTLESAICFVGSPLGK